ncbi:hypothetical protein [Streptomyces botrytidirepellens]|uniref:hypothetical protein n=1 Tax=Streptomyces botrytidirepellens TaxID=2486417 RepID=UPI001FE7C778|nr:hypothetical protein [Streptomyces botrytidirepellens]
MTTPRPRPVTVTARIEDNLDADTTPADFFVPGARYYDGDPYKAPEETHTFQCEHIATHPAPAPVRVLLASCATTPPTPTGSPSP